MIYVASTSADVEHIIVADLQSVFVFSDDAQSAKSTGAP
jgi:hypothetical protein